MHIALPIGNNILLAMNVPEAMGRVNETKIGLKSRSVQKVKRSRQIIQRTLRLVGQLKCLWQRVLGGHTLDV